MKMENKENDVSVTDSAVMAEPVGHSTLNAVKEISLTESAVVDNSIVHSTPIPIEKSDNHEMMNMMQLLLEKQNTMLRIKFDEQNVCLLYTSRCV